MKNTQYLKYLPQALLQDITNNRCFPIIGSGFSKNIDEPYSSFVLNWEELGKKISDEIMDYTYYNPIDALSAYCHEYSRAKLIERVKQLLQVNKIKPGLTHQRFSELPFDYVCTTNFDFLIEESYKSLNRIMRLIVEEDHLSISAGDESVTLIKIHGDFNYPNKMVITEEDYDSYISSNPMLATYLTNFLITRTPLFIGYSLEDYDFRIIWQIVKNRLGTLKRPAYILKVNVNNLEISRYKRRGVHVINIPGNQKEYPVIFQQLFSELSDYWNEQEIQNIKPTKEDVNIQLIKPKDSNSNLCFIVSSIKNISLYKKYIYPILQNYGIIPTTGDEIISVGDNWTAKVMSVISKADYFIVDSTSNNAAYELSLILKRNDINREHIFIIGSDENIKDNYRVNYILNNADPIYEIEEISNKIESWAEKISEENVYQISEAERLYKIKEYRPAFISAFNDMEGKLRKLFSNMLIIENNSKYFSLNNIPLRELFENAIRKELISISSNDIMKMIRTRNLAIHENCDVTYHEAKKAIELNKELLEAINKINNTNEEKNA